MEFHCQLETTSYTNGDWQNWLILHAKSDVVVQDVCDIGKPIGVKFMDDMANIFNALFRVEGRERREGGGGKDKSKGGEGEKDRVI